jgi:predicted permease
MIINSKIRKIINISFSRLQLVLQQNMVKNLGILKNVPVLLHQRIVVDKRIVVNVILYEYLFFLLYLLFNFIKKFTTDLNHECTSHHTGTSAAAPLAAAIYALVLEAK